MTEKPSTVASPPLGNRVRRGLIISLANTLVGRAGTFLVGLILARLLAPDDYGLFAIGLVVLNGLLSINELGVSLAIVRWPGDPRLIAPTVTTLALAGSTALFLVTWFAAPDLASLLGAPDALWIIRGLAIGVIFDGLTAVPAAGLTREFAQGRRMLLDLVTFGVINSVTVILALAGFGAWSLVVGRLIGGLIGTIAFLLFGTVRCWPGWNREHAGRLLAFGAPLAGTSLLVFAMANLDLGLVGAVLGPTELGFYLLAANLANWPVNLISSTVRRVSFAGFARLGDGATGRGGAFVTSLPLVLAAVLPMCIGLSILAEPVVTVLYGEQWRPAAAALRFLALLAGAKVVVDLCYDFLAADARGHWTLGIQFGWLALYFPALLLATQNWGIGGAAAANAGVAWLVAVPAFLVAVIRRGASSHELGAGLVRPLVGATALFVVVFLIQLWVHTALEVLLLTVPAGALTYLAIVWPLVHRVSRGFRQPP